MSRISLVEVYDNRDVIGQLVRLREDVNELQNILKDIDPDGDLTNVVTKTGDQTIDGIKTFVGKIVADCDIIQLGGNYETHAEQVYSKNDYIVMRDEAVSGLAPGTYSGFQIKKYNGSDDARLVVDNEGVARVGDLNDEQPLLTRDEVSDMTSGNILAWDGVNKKAITSGKSVSDIGSDISAAVADRVKGTGNIGSDTKPVKIVNGEVVEVTDTLQKELSVENITNYTVETSVGSFNTEYSSVRRYGKMVVITFAGCSMSNTGGSQVNWLKNLPVAVSNFTSTIYSHQHTNAIGYIMTDTSGNLNVATNNTDTSSAVSGQIVYFTN